MQKILLLCVCLWGNVLVSLAQAPIFNWTSTVGTPVDFPQDVAVDRAGFIYVLDRPGISKLAPDGTLVQTILAGNPRTGYAYSMDVDDAGNLYLLHYSDGRLEKLTPAGQRIWQVGSAGSGPGQFQYAESLTVDGAGNVYVADTGNNRLHKFDTNGQWLFTYGAPGTGLLTHPADVTLDANGTVYIYNENFVVTKLTPSGTLLQTLPLAAGSVTYDEATSLAVDPAGNLYSTSFRGSSILKFSATGAALGLVGAGSFDGTRTPLAIDAAGNVYASNRDHGGYSKLRKYSATGQLLNTWGNMTSLSPGVLDAAGFYYCYDPRVGAIVKYNPSGQRVGQLPNTGLMVSSIHAMAIDPLGNLYLLGLDFNSGRVQKVGPDGRILGDFTALGGNIAYNSFGAGIAADAAGIIYITDLYGGYIRRLDAQGRILPPIGGWGTGPGQLWLPQAVAVDAQGYVYATDNGGSRVQQFTPFGQMVREYGVRTTIGSSVSVSTVSMVADRVGNVYVNTSLQAGVQFFEAGTGRISTLAGVDKGDLALDPRGSRLVTTGGDLIRFYTSSQTRPENLITGLVYEDHNGNCAQDAGEPPMPGIAVVAQPGNYYGLTDESGRYLLAVDTGNYTVEQLLPTHETGRSIVPLCAGTPTVSLPTYGTSVSGPDFGNQVSTTPYLRVSVGSNRRRRCFRNVTTVAYANAGFAAAANAQVTVALPPEVAFISANAPHTRDAAGNYVFALGTLAANASGSIIIQDSVVCGNPDLRGLTVCTNAWISPLNTYPPQPAWNQAAVAVRGQAQAGNRVRFVLRNTTTAAMTDSLSLRLYQNSQLALTHRYRLAAGDSLVLRVPASRPVVRLEADQPTGHPTQRVASSTVEVPGLRLPGQPSPDMQALPTNEPGPETAQDCQPIVDSFDPNDKLVLPAGATAQHYTPTGVPLQYQVRFQNTGSDDAYRVVVVDTLAADLDLRTLRVTTATHPYRLAVSGQGRPVLTFTFSNINLPPTSRDEAGSNGFVSFSIQPKAGLAPRTLIENEADIFFDYNPPVRTNRTTNRIYDQPLTVEPAVALDYPTVLASPTLTQFMPAQGRAGTVVTLRGQRFAPAATANTVRFNGVAATVLSATATTLTVRVPAVATTGPVQVVTPDGGYRSDQIFTVYQPPTLTAVAPAEGVPGSTVTLSGTGFGTLAIQDTVWFNGIAAAVVQASATRLTVVVPATATSGPIRVSTLGGTVASTQAFTVWYPPTLVSFSPARGKAGTLVSVVGSQFAPAGRNTVSVGSNMAATVVQATPGSLQIRVPAGAQSGPIRVQTPGGAVASATAFTFLPAPAIAAFSPAQASVGDVLTLTGTNFLVDGLPDTVYVGGRRAAVLTASATSATVRVPAGAASGPVAMHGTGGTGLAATNFTLLPLSAPESISVYPNPAHGLITLDWLRADFAVERVQVYNALGGLIQDIDVRQHATTSLPLQFSANTIGLYLVVVHTARGNVVKRVTLY